jgi:hypothetical protein
MELISNILIEVSVFMVSFVCVCVCVCARTHACAHVHGCKHVRGGACMCLCVCVCIYRCTLVLLFVLMNSKINFCLS